ncbi:uncharacterized protein N7511_006673 [Penicillium nucicola]|uniref:uncharacterized protein n=1 Tax=Penicillium nucicola TaxID=1850975 RepID=UPI0025455674|nr:uncharacterized protein N7511_006673 [Penicillium nucicola]KAJ5757979.1 hypothetical protein N7511_006673 [Penicillium nucicola]
MVHHLDVNCYTIWVVIYVAIGTVSSAYGLAIIGSTVGQPNFHIYFNLPSEGESGYAHTTNMIGALNGVNSAGAIIGCIFQAWAGDYFGRRWAMQTGLIILIIGGALCAGSVDMGMFIFARSVAGIGSGILACIVPTYQSEIATAESRGAMVATTGIMYAVGYTLAAWLVRYWSTMYTVHPRRPQMRDDRSTSSTASPRDTAPGARSHQPKSEGSRVPVSTKFDLTSIEHNIREKAAEDAGRILTGASLPGDIGADNAGDQVWRLQVIDSPPVPVMNVLIDAFFQRMQWFILVFVEPSFRATAERIIGHQEWRREDLGSCMAALVVAAIGLQSALPDADWPGHAILRAHNIDANNMLKGLIAEIRLHLLDTLEDCQIEAVQIPILLSCYYVFHNSPGLAWTVVGMAVRAASALDIQNTSSSDPIMEETRSRCWNHLIVSDTFTSMVYGRSVSIDHAQVHPLTVVNDLMIDPWVLNHCPVAPHDQTIGRDVFHVMKAEVYGIVHDTLVRFRQLRLGPRISDGDLETIAQIVRESDENLRQWRHRVPRIFDFDFWISGGWEKICQNLQAASEAVKEQAETVFLQAAILQLTYDSALIQIHRSLLERRSRTIYKPVADAIHRSLVEATAAALRISQIPVDKFQRHFGASFVSMQQFTAGVILCIQPTFSPFSPAALEAKTGVMKIIRASRAVGYRNRIAKHTEQLLTELLKVTNQRELSRALGNGTEATVSKDTTVNWPTTPTTRQAPMAGVGPHQGEMQASASESLLFDIAGASDDPSEIDYAINFPSAYIFEDLDNTFGAFGEFMFNMAPDGQNSIWNWGRTFP